MNLNDLNKINFKQRLIISLLIFLSAFFSLIYFLLFPTISSIKKLKTDITNQRLEMEEKINQEHSMNKLNENLKKISSEVDSLNHIFINKNNELEFITLLEGLANKNKVQQTLNLNTEKTIKNNHFQKVPISISISGNYPDLLSYLKDIEKLKLYVNINNLDLSISSNEDSENKQKPHTNPLNKKGQLLLNADTFWK